MSPSAQAIGQTRRASLILSGSAGLIYESIWSHYLKLFLGHAAYAQSLVLVVFMGGMCLGSLLLPKYISPAHHPLKVYAFLELGIGLFGVMQIFTAMNGDLTIDENIAFFAMSEARCSIERLFAP